jgi:sulfate adenylyltransferase subunit 1 (EFTu-like GTPase family)
VKVDGILSDVREKSKVLQRIVKGATNYCIYCGKIMKESEKSIDYIKPISRNGKSSSDNIICCCKKCNQKKANSRISEELEKEVKNKQDKYLKIYREKKRNQRNKDLEQKLLNNKKIKIYQLRIILRRISKRRRLNIDDICNYIDLSKLSLRRFINNESGIEKQEYLKLYKLLQDELIMESKKNN